MKGTGQIRPAKETGEWWVEDGCSLCGSFNHGSNAGRCTRGRGLSPACVRATRHVIGLAAHQDQVHAHGNCQVALRLPAEAPEA